MITILAIIFGWFLLAELIKSAAQKSRQRKEQRLAAARKREADRLQRLRDADAEERERVRRELLEHDLAIVQMQKEQIRQAKEQAKLAKEQERQAEILRKHEEQIRTLNRKIEQAELDIDFLLRQFKSYNEHGEYLERERDACIYGSTNWQKWNKKVLANDSKVHEINAKMNRAYGIKEEAEIKLREVA